MNTTAENQNRIETGCIGYARQLTKSKKPMYDAKTSPLYSQCVFHSDLCNTRCVALIEPVCFKCDECHFFKSKEDWHRDPYSGYVEKRKKNA